jgi:hypothetical protein
MEQAKGRFVSQKIRFHHVLLEHPLGIKKRAIDGDGMAHNDAETLRIAVAAEDVGHGMKRLTGTQDMFHQMQWKLDYLRTRTQPGEHERAHSPYATGHRLKHHCPHGSFRFLGV